MRIEIKRGVCLGGGKDAYPGEVVEVADFFGNQLIMRGSAVQTDKPVTTKASATPAAKGTKAAAKPADETNQKGGDDNA
jgi:hypothetical protein